MNMSRAVALLCLLAVLPAFSQGECEGDGEYLSPQYEYRLKLKKGDDSLCLNYTTDPDYRFVMDCSRRRFKFNTGERGCDLNTFVFYPGGMIDSEGVEYCGKYRDLVLKSDGPILYAEWLNEWPRSRKNKIKCGIRMEKIPTTSKPVITTQKPITTTAKPGPTLPKPITTTAKPGPTLPKPVTTTTKPGITLPTPAITTTKPVASTIAPKCACGQHNKEGVRIVNGQTTKPNEYPFFAGLFLNNDREPFCGGSLISAKWVLTAAHCMTDAVNKIRVVLGSHDLNKVEASSKRFEIERYINHEQYSSQRFDYDVAVIELKVEVDFSNTISPVCLPPPSFNEKAYEKTVTVIGYGNLAFEGQGATVLQHVMLRLYSRKQCGVFQPDMKDDLTYDMICAYSYKKDSCHGDSGGPLVFEKDNRLVQVGIVSHGEDCAVPNSPGVYANVEVFVEWIKVKTGTKFCGV